MKVFEPEESIVNVSLPEIDFVPFHEPEALQDEAFDDLRYCNPWWRHR